MTEPSELAELKGLGLAELDEPAELGVPEGLGLAEGLTLGLTTVFGLPEADVVVSELGVAEVTAVGVGAKAEGLADCSVFFLLLAESLNI